MDHRSDAALVAAALNGDREAFSALVRKYQDCAYGLAFSRLSDFDLARDVVQEAFLCAYRDLGRLKEPERFAGWLRGIVRNVSLHALRDVEQVRALAKEAGATAQPFDAAPRPDEAAEAAERGEIVRQALGRLSENHREAVSLYYVDGLSYADIAGFLEVTETAVQGRLQRARAQLRKELKMVQETFKDAALPLDFASEVRRLLDSAARDAEEQKRAVQRLAEIGAPAVDPLCEALDDPRAPVNRVAARALCRIADPKSLRPILDRLFERAHVKGSWQAAIMLDGGLLRLPGIRPVLFDYIRNGPWSRQWVALRALSRADGDPEAIDAVRAVYRDPAMPGRVRAAAMETLCRLTPQDAASLIEDTLAGPDDLMLRVPWFAVRRGVLPSLPALVRVLGRDLNWWNRVCVGKLILRHGEPGRRALEQLMRSGNPNERCSAAQALADHGSSEAFKALKEDLVAGGGERKWFKVVTRTLARRYPRETCEWLLSDTPDEGDLAHILWILAKSGEPVPAGPTVEQLYEVGKTSVRRAALRILARDRGVAFLPELRRRLRESHPGPVAHEAFRQMLRLGDAALPVAQEMIKSEHWTERKAAVALLRRWGKLSPADRVRAQADPHVAVRNAAALAAS